MIRKLRILLFTDEMLPGGVARHVTDLANGFLERGHQVHVAATTGPYVRRLHQGVKFSNLPLMKVGQYRKEMLGVLESWGHLQKLMRQGDFDLIHTHKRYSDLLGRAIARLFGKPHISTCHNTFDGGKWFSPFGDYTIAVSEAIRRMLIEGFSKDSSKITVIVNGISAPKESSHKDIEVLRQHLGVGAKTLIILCVGQFIAAKGHSILIDALEILHRREPQRLWLCVLAGHGELRPAIEAKIRSHGLTEHMAIVDGTQDPQNLFALADFCVLPSVRDGGIPYTIMEGASMKKPFIASNVGGIPEFIHHERNGILVRPNDPATLADGIGLLLRSRAKTRRLGYRAFTQYVSHHSSNAYIDRTLEVYDRALQSRS